MAPRVTHVPQHPGGHHRAVALGGPRDGLHARRAAPHRGDEVGPQGRHRVPRHPRGGLAGWTEVRRGP